MLEWVAARARSCRHVDGQLPTRRRAVWRKPDDGKQYEMGHFISDIPANHQWWSGLRTFAMLYGDHLERR